MTSGGLFDDGKDDGALRTIGEVSQALSIKPHVLRYWEQQFPMLKPLKRSGGRRYYRTGDVAMVKQIDRLVNRDGFTLKGALQALKAGTAAENPAEGETERLDGIDRTAIIADLKAIRGRLAALA